jgi:hypothetical protein
MSPRFLAKRPRSVAGERSDSSGWKPGGEAALRASQETVRRMTIGGRIGRKACSPAGIPRVYFRSDGKWKTIHSHWSYIRPEVKRQVPNVQWRAERYVL